MWLCNEKKEWGLRRVRAFQHPDLDSQPPEHWQKINFCCWATQSVFCYGTPNELIQCRINQAFCFHSIIALAKVTFIVFPTYIHSIRKHLLSVYCLPGTVNRRNKSTVLERLSSWGKNNDFTISTGKEINRKIRQKTTTEGMCVRWEGGKKSLWEEMPLRLIWWMRTSWPCQRYWKSIPGAADSKHRG